MTVVDSGVGKFFGNVSIGKFVLIVNLYIGTLCIYKINKINLCSMHQVLRIAELLQGFSTI